MWQICLFITILMGCATATVATLSPHTDVSPMGEATIFLLIGTFFVAMFTAD